MTYHLLQTLFAFKKWADQEIVESVASTAFDAFPEARHSGLRTLNHMHVIDAIFQGHLLGRDHGYSGLNTPETPTPAALRGKVERLDDWYIAFAATQNDETLSERIAFAFIDGSSGAMTRGEILGHILTHGAYHRGAVGQLLDQNGIAPPRAVLTVYTNRIVPKAQ